MIDMELNEGTIYPTMRIAQSSIGELEIAAMVFSSALPPNHIRFCHKISIRNASKNPAGWGDVIFEGTLKDLIDLVIRKENIGETHPNQRQNHTRNSPI